MEEENKTIEETTPEQAGLIEEGVAPETAAPAEAAAQEQEAPATMSAPVEKETSKEQTKEKPMTKGKRIANAIILGIQVAFVLLAITVCLVVLLNPKAQDEISPLGVKLLTVRTDSMDGDQPDSFTVDDLIVATNPKDRDALEVGDIVSFKAIEKYTGIEFINTHRIVDINTELEHTQYLTKGDNSPDVDGWLASDQILAVYSFKIKGLGAAIKFIRDGYHFIYVVIIPLGLLLIYNVYLVIQIIMEGKMKKAKAAAAADALSNLSQEDIEKLLAARGIDPSAIQAQAQQEEDHNNDQ